MSKTVHAVLRPIVGVLNGTGELVEAIFGCAVGPVQRLHMWIDGHDKCPTRNAKYEQEGEAGAGIEQTNGTATSRHREEGEL